MNGSIVYSNTLFNSTHNTISIGHHTEGIYVHNFDQNIAAVVELNGKHQVVIPDSPNAGGHNYHFIPGDYTTIKVLTAAVDLCMYAIG